jgi:DNA-binding NarL/FixJ family response regulator
MLSAFDDSSGMPQRAMAMGASGYIHKDGRIQAIPEQLCMIVRGATAERAARSARGADTPGQPVGGA